MPNNLELRAREPVASCLIRKLIVPRVYFGAQWPIGSGTTVDVLAIDRDGSGDAHVVLVREHAAEALASIPDLLGQPGPFRWIAFMRGTEDEASRQKLVSQDLLYAGVGYGLVPRQDDLMRIAFTSDLHVDVTRTEATCELAKRFRVSLAGSRPRRPRDAPSRPDRPNPLLGSAGCSCSRHNSAT